MSIPFTQYLRPDGRTRRVTIDRSPEIEEKATYLISKGFYFEDKCLLKDKEGPALAGEICNNGPEVPLHVDKMIIDAYNTYILSL